MDRWGVKDGDEGRESSNGTWESVQDYFTRQLIHKDESQPKRIDDKTEIKISESIFRFDYVNFNIRKK